MYQIIYNGEEQGMWKNCLPFLVITLGWLIIEFIEQQIIGVRLRGWRNLFYGITAFVAGALMTYYAFKLGIMSL